MVETSMGGQATAGKDHLLGIGILYFCSAGIVLSMDYANSALFTLGFSLQLISMMSAFMAIGLLVIEVIIIILLLVAGRKLDRPYIRAAGVITLVSILLGVVLSFIFPFVGTSLIHTLEDAGLPAGAAVFIVSGLIISLPNAVPALLFSVFLLKDASRTGLSRVLPIVAIATIASNAAYISVLIGLAFTGFYFPFDIPFSAMTSIAWGVYFLLAKKALIASV